MIVSAVGNWLVAGVPEAPAAAASLGVALALYVAGALRVRRWPAIRAVAFTAGIAVLYLAVGSGLALDADRRLSMHMVEHLLIATIGPLLVWLGAPVELALRAVRGRPRRVLASLLGSRPVRGLAHPLSGLGAIVLAMAVTHLAAFYDAAVEHPAVHAAQHAIYFVAGMCFWAPLVGPAMLGRLRGALERVLYLAASMIPMALIAVWLMTAQHVAYTPYLAEAASPHAALADQHVAAMVMLGGGNAVVGVALLWLGWSAVLAEERRQVRREEALARSPGLVSVARRAT
jgi:cytochrome c oxidase assembly factor CtaG